MYLDRPGYSVQTFSYIYYRLVPFSEFSRKDRPKMGHTEKAVSVADCWPFSRLTELTPATSLMI